MKIDDIMYKIRDVFTNDYYGKCLAENLIGYCRGGYISEEDTMKLLQDRAKAAFMLNDEERAKTIENFIKAVKKVEKMQKDSRRQELKQMKDVYVKTCPFCNTNATIMGPYESDERSTVWPYEKIGKKTGFFVMCKHCGIKLMNREVGPKAMFYTVEQAAEAWNTRYED